MKMDDIGLEIRMSKDSIILDQLFPRNCAEWMTVVIPINKWSDVNAAVRTMADDLKTLSTGATQDVKTDIQQG